MTVLTRADAIVLHSFKLTDKKLVVDLLTADGNRRACVATAGGGSRSRLRRQLFQPLTLLSVAVDMRPAARLQRLVEATMAETYVTISTDPVKMSIALFIAEFLYHATKGEQQNAALYAYTVNSLRWLDAAEPTACANFHLVFTMRLARFLGFTPNTDGYHPGYVFDLRQACFTADATHADCLTVADSERVVTLMRMDYETMHLFRMSHNERNHIADIVTRFYSLQLPAFPEMRSLQVLRQLWA